jgi:hypothetical protein
VGEHGVGKSVFSVKAAEPYAKCAVEQEAPKHNQWGQRSEISDRGGQMSGGDQPPGDCGDGLVRGKLLLRCSSAEKGLEIFILFVGGMIDSEIQNRSVGFCKVLYFLS